MANRESYVEFLLEQLAPLGDVTGRRMFGGHALYCNGVVFALVSENALYLKVDDQNRAQFEARGLDAFRPYEDQTVALGYFEAPPELFEDREALMLWGGGAVAAGSRAAAKGAAKKKRGHSTSRTKASGRGRE